MGSTEAKWCIQDCFWKSHGSLLSRIEPANRGVSDTRTLKMASSIPVAYCWWPFWVHNQRQCRKPVPRLGKVSLMVAEAEWGREGVVEQGVPRQGGRLTGW